MLSSATALTQITLAQMQAWRLMHEFALDIWNIAQCRLFMKGMMLSDIRWRYALAC